VLFELLDLKGYGRLGHEQRFSCLREGQVLCDGVEYLKATFSHGVLKGEFPAIST
jgi:hypothetical protein